MQKYHRLVALKPGKVHDLKPAIATPTPSSFWGGGEPYACTKAVVAQERGSWQRLINDGMGLVCTGAKTFGC